MYFLHDIVNIVLTHKILKLRMHHIRISQYTGSKTLTMHNVRCDDAITKWYSIMECHMYWALIRAIETFNRTKDKRDMNAEGVVSVVTRIVTGMNRMKKG